MAKNQQQSLPENFTFELFGAGTKVPFTGYISSVDPTVVGPGVLIGGSVNVFKALSGAIYNRAGLLRRGAPDNTLAGTVRSYEWENSFNVTRVLRAVNGTLQVEYLKADGTIQYVTLLSGLTQAQMNFSFTPWYDSNAGQDQLIFVNGQQIMYAWSGGLIAIASAANTAGIISEAAAPNDISNLLNLGAGIYASGGVNYAVGDLLTVTGGNSDAVVQVDTVAAGGVATFQIQVAGTGYAVNDVVAAGNGSSQAGFLVTSIGGGGAVTGLQLLTAGIGNTAASFNVTVVSTAGTGLRITFLTVGNTITSWHLFNNGSGYAATAAFAPAVLTGGAGTAATFQINQVIIGRISVAGTRALNTLGFPGKLTPTNGVYGSFQTGTFGGSILVEGVTYTYQGLGDNGLSFVGITPDPTGLAGKIASNVVVTTDTSSTSTANAQTISGVVYYQSRLEQYFFNDAVVTINNQIYLMCYSSQIVHVGSILNYTHFDVDYLATGVLRAPGFPDLLILDSNSRGASARDGDAVVFGSQGDSYLITRLASIYNQDNASGDNTAFSYEQVTVSKQISSDLSSPIDQNFISSLNDSIIFLDENNQLRQFGTLRNLSTPVYPILSLDIYTELARGDFTGGMLRVIAEQSGESVYVTSPVTGKLYIYQVRFKVSQVGDMTAERLWQAPFVVGCSTVAVVEGITYIYSNVNPQMYQLWDTGQYYDDGSVLGDQLPYSSHAVFSYLTLGRTQQMNFDKLYFEGYMTRGSTLFSSTYMEYQGAKGIQPVTINNPVNPGKKIAKFYGATDCPVPGESILGNIEIGDGILPPQTTDTPLPKFRAIRRVKSLDVFEAAIDVWSEDVDSQWGILLVGANLQAATRQPTGIMGLPGLLT